MIPSMVSVDVETHTHTHTSQACTADTLAWRHNWDRVKGTVDFSLSLGGGRGRV